MQIKQNTYPVSRRWSSTSLVRQDTGDGYNIEFESNMVNHIYFDKTILTRASVCNIIGT